MIWETDKPLTSPIEFDWAVKQLQALGLVELKDEGIALTVLGKNKAVEIEQTIDITDRIILMLYHWDTVLNEES